VDEFEHDLLHLVCGMIEALEEWKKKIEEHINKKYVESKEKENVEH
jgi:hypothetical protein